MSAVRKTLLDLISTCERFTFGEGNEWSGAFSLFKKSYSFQESAKWMASLQWDAVWHPEAQSAAHFHPGSRHQFTLQSLYIGTVHEVGQRMLGWSDLDTALHTLAQWLRVFRSCPGHDSLDEGHLTLFARALLGGAQSRESLLNFQWLSEFAAMTATRQLLVVGRGDAVFGFGLFLVQSATKSFPGRDATSNGRASVFHLCNGRTWSGASVNAIWG